jgi:C1A family cysteine protease
VRIHKISLMTLALAALGGCAADPASQDPGEVSDDPVSDYGALMDGVPDNDTLPDDNKADAVYPKKFDLVAEQSPVQNQQSRGVCSIFSTVALMENLYIKAGQPMPDFSEQYLQWAVKNLVGDFPNTSGSNASSNLQAIHEYGIPVEAMWPYEGKPWDASNDPACNGGENLPTPCYTNGKPPAAAQGAPMFKLPRGRYVNTNSIKANLFTKKVGVIVGLDFFYQAWAHRRSTLPTSAEYRAQGIVVFPSAKDIEESHKQRAGHSILLVGWDDDLEMALLDEEGKPLKNADGKVVTEKGFYIFKNSWGTANWSTESAIGPGYGYISMRYIERYGSAYTSDVPELTDDPPPPPGGDHFEAAPNAAIPDDDATGVSNVIRATGEGRAGTIEVTVDISHTYVGDLTVTLKKGQKTITIHEQAGGADDDLKKSFTLTDFETSMQEGDWTLTVVDSAAQDTGTLNRWAIDFK